MAPNLTKRGRESKGDQEEEEEIISFVHKLNGSQANIREVSLNLL